MFNNPFEWGTIFGNERRLLACPPRPIFGCQIWSGGPLGGGTDFGVTVCQSVFTAKSPNLCRPNVPLLRHSDMHLDIVVLFHVCF